MITMKSTLFKVAGAIALMSILSLPAIINETYTRLTTHSLKEYSVYVDDIDTSRIGGFGMQQFYINVRGDTTAKLYEYMSTQFEENKKQSFTLRKYGFLGEYRIEKVKDEKDN